MLLFVSKICEQKREHYLALFNEWQRLKNRLRVARENDDFRTVGSAKLLLEEIELDAKQMFELADSRCILPSFNQLLDDLLRDARVLPAADESEDK